MRRLLMVWSVQNRYRLAAEQPPCSRRVSCTLGVNDVVTPFWTVTDNPTPFAVIDQITPTDTDWLSVLICREITGLSVYRCVLS